MKQFYSKFVRIIVLIFLASFFGSTQVSTQASVETSTEASTQSLTLTKDKRTKKIPTGHLIEVAYSKDHVNNDEYDYCYSKSSKGILTEVTTDSIQMLVQSFSDSKDIEEFYYSSNIQYKSEEKFLMIPKDQIFWVTHFKNKKVENRRKAFKVLGGASIFIGLGSAITVIVLPDDSSKKALVRIGAFEVGLGILAAAIFRDRKFDLKKSNLDPWAIN